MFEKLEEIRRKYEEVKARLADPEFVQDHRSVREAQKTLADFQPIIQKMEEQRQVQKEIDGARELVESLSPGDELYQMAAAERASLTERLQALEGEIKVLLLPRDPNDSRNVFLEIRAGTGGDESALFAGSLLRMYVRYAERHRLQAEIVSASASDLGGYKEVIVRIVGQGVYSKLKFESGGHRVQRVPETEAQGRIHTSACTVAVIAEADPIADITINPADIRIDTFRASGAGGQHVNKTDSAVRITHLPTGLVVECQDDRSQHRNRAQAWDMLRARLYEMELKKREAQAVIDQANKTDIGWGHQIRSYVLQPYQLVKDLRTGATSGTPSEVLDGELDSFMEAALAQRLSGGGQVAVEDVH